MVQKKEQPVSLFKNIEQVKEKFLNKDAIIFLDYDGTLTPIVDTPDQALLSSEMREKINKLSKIKKVAIVSGRATDDVRKKVNINGIFYAGSHGFEIVDPQGKIKINEQAREIKKEIDQVHEELSDKLSDVQGALVEHVKYTISVHYRLVESADFDKVKTAVEEVLKDRSNLRMTSGKKVFEIRPDIDWDKGKAVEWILDVLCFNPQKQIAVYIGDDTTDEDAFKILKNKGFGILVADNQKDTYARYQITDTKEVGKVLDFFLSLKAVS